MKHFGVDGDGNIVANDDTAVVHGLIPFHAKILAVDLGSGIDGDALIAPGILDRGGGTIDIQDARA